MTRLDARRTRLVKAVATVVVIGLVIGFVAAIIGTSGSRP
jgi:tetrahydromethanopterin S-methyltransferase subunit F